MADLCCSIAETNTTFQTNYTPIKKEIYIKNKQKKYDNQKKKCDLKKKKREMAYWLET